MNEKARIKKPTTLKEQVAILRSRNLLIKDEDEAIEILSRVNYYRLSAYMLSYKDNDLFTEGISIKNIYDIYEFDKKFRHLIMELLETIEISFRTQIAYFISHKYGSLSYKNSKYFVNQRIHQEMLIQLTNETRRSNEVFVKHHRDKYEGVFPIWVAFELTSFGLLSRIYSNFKNEIRAEIASTYYKLPHTYIKSWLYSLSSFRNICAHYGRIYNKSLVIKPMLQKSDVRKGVKNDSPFAILFIVGKLIQDKSEWSSFVTSIEVLIEQYEVIDVNLMGFPENWVQLLDED